MRRIIFVDDEQRVLDGLASSLRRYRKQWDMTFVCGGRAALDRLAVDTPFDVIVSDARMPDLDGESLLRETQQRFPDMARLVLSGQTDEGATRRLMDVAHQFLAKPCDSAVLFEAVERACALREMLGNTRLRALVTQAGRLPAPPTTYTQLTALLERPDVGVADVAKAIERNPSLAAKLLQVVNSAFFGLAQKMTRVQAAATYLGLETVRILTLSVEVAASLEVDVPTALQERVLGEQNLVVARVARALAGKGPLAEVAFTAALLKDVGVLLLATREREAWVPLVREAGEDAARLVAAERERFGCDHAQVGAYLLSLWGLPAGVVQAVASHHGPVQPVQGEVTAAHCVYVSTLAIEGAAVPSELAGAGLEPLLERARSLAREALP
ncbi:MAG: response regulator [Myxococcota bacterium]